MDVSAVDSKQVIEDTSNEASKLWFSSQRNKSHLPQRRRIPLLLLGALRLIFTSSILIGVAIVFDLLVAF